MAKVNDSKIPFRAVHATDWLTLNWRWNPGLQMYWTRDLPLNLALSLGTVFPNILISPVLTESPCPSKGQVWAGHRLGSSSGQLGTPLQNASRFVKLLGALSED